TGVGLLACWVRSCRAFLAASAAVRPRVERVPETVAEEVEREDREHDHGPREHRGVQRAAEVPPTLVEHRAPLGRGRLGPQPEEAEVRGGQDRRRHAQRSEERRVGKEWRARWWPYR